MEAATHAFGTWIEERLKAHGVDQAEAHILGRLATDGVCSINDLHREFFHRRSTLTNIVDRLEKKGLVNREPNPLSRRSINVRLTPTGYAMAGEVGELLASAERSIRARTTATDVAGFNRVLSAIKEVAVE
jgi:DNA-binding MarR family transcriptional regulator